MAPLAPLRRQLCATIALRCLLCATIAAVAAAAAYDASSPTVYDASSPTVAHYAAATAAYEGGDTERALAAFRAAARFGPTSSAWYNVGSTALELSQGGEAGGGGGGGGGAALRREAADAFWRALELDPSNADAAEGLQEARQAEPARQQAPAQAPSGGGRTDEMLNAMFGVGGERPEFERALRLWAAHAGEIDFEQLREYEDADGAERPILLYLLGHTQMERGVDRQRDAWPLITALLPALHRHPKDLRVVYRGERATPDSDWAAFVASPLLVATEAGETQAAHFLADRGYCEGVRKADGQPDWDHAGGQPSPLSNLLHLAHLWTMLRDLVFKHDHRDGSNGIFTGRATSVSMNQAYSSLSWARLRELWDLPESKKLLGDSIAERRRFGTYTVRLTLIQAVANRWTGANLAPILKCFTPELLNLGNYEGRSPLHLAAYYDNHVAARMMIEAGSDPAQADRMGWTALHLARATSARSVAGVLEANSPEIIDKPDSAGYTARNIKAKQDALGLGSNRMRDDAKFRSTVQQWYKQFNSSLGDTGGWDAAQLTSSLHGGIEIDHCDLAEISAEGLVMEDFMSDFVIPGKPVIIRGGAAGFHAREVFRNHTMTGEMGDIDFEIGKIPYQSEFTAEKGETVTQEEYIGRMPALAAQADATLNTSARFAPNYIFSVFFPARERLLGKDGADIPDIVEWISKERDGTAMGVQYFLGAPGTGAPMHYHEAAWNALIYGSKRWFMLPPHAAIYSTKPALLFFKEDYPKLLAESADKPWLRPYECMQRAGDVIVMPTGWGHATINTAASVGVAEEFRGGSL